MNRIILLGVVAAVATVSLVAYLGGSDNDRLTDAALAQDQGAATVESEPGPQAAPDEGLIETQRRFQELEQELRGIQERVLAENDDLQARAEELDDRLFDRMEATGYDDPRGDVRRLERILERMEAGEISEQEAQAQLEEQADLHVRLQQAHQEAMQDEAFAERLAEDQRTLSEEVTATMKATEPRTDEILEEMAAIEQALIREFMENEGDDPPSPGAAQE